MKIDNLCYIEQERVYLSDVEIAEMLITGRKLEMCTNKPLYRVPDTMYRLGGNVWRKANVQYGHPCVLCLSPIISLSVILKINGVEHKDIFEKGLYYFIDGKGCTRRIRNAQEIMAC